MWLGVCPQPYDYKQAHVEQREMGQSWITRYPAKAARRVHAVKRPGTLNDTATANSPLASAAIGCNCFASTGLNTTLMAKTTNDAQQDLGGCGRVTRYFHEKPARVKPFFSWSCHSYIRRPTNGRHS